MEAKSQLSTRLCARPMKMTMRRTEPATTPATLFDLSRPGIMMAEILAKMRRKPLWVVKMEKKKEKETEAEKAEAEEPSREGRRQERPSSV